MILIEEIFLKSSKINKIGGFFFSFYLIFVKLVGWFALILKFEVFWCETGRRAIESKQGNPPNHRKRQQPSLTERSQAKQHLLQWILMSRTDQYNRGDSEL